MIKVNVIVGDKIWKKYVKKPDVYLKDKIKIIKNKDLFFKKKDLEFSLLLSNSVEIRKLNKKFRKINKTTDVLSFPFYEKIFLLARLKKKTPTYLGDIVINLSKVEGKSTKELFEENFNKLWIHGFLHLLGGRHKLNRDYLSMQKQEIKYLTMLN